MNAPETSPDRRKKTLVIGYGNELRGDDGAGRKLAEEVESWGIDGVETLSVRQLAPEIASALHGCSRAVFADATAANDTVTEVRVIPLGPHDNRTAAPPRSHHCGPNEILALAAKLYGATPAAVLITIPGVDFGFSESLSPRAAANLSVALDAARRLIEARPADGIGWEKDPGFAPGEFTSRP